MSKDRNAPVAVPPPRPEQSKELRAAIAEGDLHVSLWRALRCDGSLENFARRRGSRGGREEELVEKVRDLFAAETEQPTVIAKTNAIS